jgi:sn-glycerol 3-phosphate transport system permease protein
MMVIIAAAWKQISLQLPVLPCGLQSIPKSMIEAAAIDGASPAAVLDHRLPALSPTTFFLLVVNLVYAFFDTFAIIHATTSGGPRMRPRSSSTGSIPRASSGRTTGRAPRNR